MSKELTTVKQYIRSKLAKTGKLPSYITVWRFVSRDPSKIQDAPKSQTWKQYILSCLQDVSGSFSVEAAHPYAPHFVNLKLCDYDYLLPTCRLCFLMTELIKKDNGYVGMEGLFKTFGGSKATFIDLKNNLIRNHVFRKVANAAPLSGVVARYDIGKKHPLASGGSMIDTPKTAWAKIK